MPSSIYLFTRGGVPLFRGGCPYSYKRPPTYVCIEGVPVLTAECSYAKRGFLMYGVPPNRN